MRLALLTLILSACSACHDPTLPIHAVISCTEQNHAAIEAVLASMLPLIQGNKPDWSAVEGQAISAGEAIGGCAFAELYQQYTATPKGVVLQPHPSPARDAFEHYRARVGNPIYVTPAGQL